MEEKDIFDSFKNLIQNHCGMMITDVHQGQLEKYLSDRKEKDGISPEDLYASVLAHEDELISLVNAVVVNETYFFREEKQFKFLEDHIKGKFAGKPIVMWSAASSSGEEAYSLASLALSCNARPVVYATDIDTDALAQLKSGIYGMHSFRSDGQCFKPCIEPYITESVDAKKQVCHMISQTLKDKIICSRANLVELDKSGHIPKDGTVDVIFIRNVFIYFNKATRTAILKRLAGKLKDGGLMFFSISEIGSMTAGYNETGLVKKCCNSIYYFQKNEKKDSVVEMQAGDGKPMESNKALLNGRLEQLKMEILRQEKTAVPEEAKTEESGKTAVPETKLNHSIPQPQQPAVQEIWEKLTAFTDRKDFKQAENLLKDFNPGIKNNFYKYYFEAFLNSARKNEAGALQLYEKSSIANPKFWPSYFQIALLLQDKDDAVNKKKLFNAYMKTAEILEEKKDDGKYTWLFGTFSTGYFLKICRDYMKRLCP